MKLKRAQRSFAFFHVHVVSVHEVNNYADVVTTKETLFANIFMETKKICKTVLDFGKKKGRKSRDTVPSIRIFLSFQSICHVKKTCFAHRTQVLLTH